MNKILNISFYKQDASIVAKKLLGTYLIHQSPEGQTIGKIVETEAYLSINDPASHSFKGLTNRNSVMFGPPGRAYIYYIYGMYYCFNVVTGKKGSGQAVLIRALEPIEGIPLMKLRRNKDEITELANGPAKLVQAMGITKNLNGSDLTHDSIQISQPRAGDEIDPNEIKVSGRVGISKGNDMLLRYYLKKSKFVSKY